VSNITTSLNFYEGLGFERESQPNSESGKALDTALNLTGAVVTTVKMNYIQQEHLPHTKNTLRLELVQFHDSTPTVAILDSYLPVLARMHLCFSVLSITDAVEQIMRLGGHPPQQQVTPQMNIVFAYDPDWHPLELIAYP
jgi:predicted lactoylglutathione lyase